MGLEELAWGSIGVRIEGAVGGASLAIGDLIAQMRGFVGVDLTPLRRARHAALSVRQPAHVTTHNALRRETRNEEFAVE